MILSDRSPLTPEQIDTMPAGPELNTLVAEYVMGFVNILDDHHRMDCQECKRLVEMSYWGKSPHQFEPLDYSDDIGIAWDVVEKLVELGYEVKIVRSQDAYWGNEVELVKLGDKSDWQCFASRCETVPVAISRAALKVVMS